MFFRFQAFPTSLLGRESWRFQASLDAKAPQLRSQRQPDGRGNALGKTCNICCIFFPSRSTGFLQDRSSCTDFHSAPGLTGSDVDGGKHLRNCRGGAGGVRDSYYQLTNQLTRGGYPLGIVVNREGARFVDEGADFRNYTYARYGKDILQQPGVVAYQLFDATTRPMLRAEEYQMPGVSVIEADDLATLAERAGIDPAGLERTVAEFNAGIDTGRGAHRLRSLGRGH